MKRTVFSQILFVSLITMTSPTWMLQALQYLSQTDRTLGQELLLSANCKTCNTPDGKICCP